MMMLCPLGAWADDVASVTIDGNTSYYNNWADAATAAAEGTAEKPATIQVLRDITLSAGAKINFTAGVITFELNGKTISGAYSQILKITGTADITITDNSEGQNGSIISDNEGAVYAEGCTLTIHKGTFSGSPGLYAVNSTVSLDGGHYTSPHSSAVYIDGSSSALASGYVFCDADNNVLTDSYTTPIYAYNTEDTEDTPAQDVTVKAVTTDLALASVTIDGNTTYCGSLADAATAAAEGTAEKPATIKLLKDIPLPTGVGVDFTAGVMTLDLNGKAISGASVQILNISGTADLTITDNSEGQTGSVTNKNTHAVYTDGGKLTIHAGTFASTQAFGLYATNSTVSLDGGHYTTASAYYSAVYINCSSSALASGYAYCDVDNNILTDYHDRPIFAIDGTSDCKDITVKAVTADMAFASVTIDGNTSYYGTLADAATAAAEGTAEKPATIQVLKDITLSAGTVVDFTAGVITLDLNGKAISGMSSQILNISETADITITDNSESKNGSITNDGVCAVYAEGCTLTIHTGTFRGDYGLYAVNSTVSLDGGHYISPIYIAVYIKGSSSALASGYVFCDADNNVLTDSYTTPIYAYNTEDTPAQDVTVVKDPSTSIATVFNAEGKNTAVFNAMGQRVNANAKGLVIKNGHKCFNK